MDSIMTAKYYVYRNLNKDCFSVKLRGKVIDWPTCFEMHNVDFKVSEAGQKRVREQQHRNVHAYVCSEDYKKLNFEESYEAINREIYTQVTYNPYDLDTFINCETGEPIHHADYVLGYQNRIYVRDR